jgi:hypothetical protein
MSSCMHGEVAWGRTPRLWAAAVEETASHVQVERGLEQTARPALGLSFIEAA